MPPDVGAAATGRAFVFADFAFTSEAVAARVVSVSEVSAVEGSAASCVAAFISAPHPGQVCAFSNIEVPHFSQIIVNVPFLIQPLARPSSSSNADCARLRTAYARAPPVNQSFDVIR
jgi:hypothetical protein